MQLRWFFSTFIAFFSDFVHFTLKLFKILYYLCTAIQNHRTLIALSSRYHRTHVQVQPRSGVPVAPRRVPVACGCSKRFQDPSVSLMRWKMVARTKNNFVKFWEILFLIMNKIPKIIQDYSFSRQREILFNLEKFCSFKYKSKQVYLVLFFLFTPARFIPNPLVPAPRSFLSGGHGGNWLWV